MVSAFPNRKILISVGRIYEGFVFEYKCKRKMTIIYQHITSLLIMRVSTRKVRNQINAFRCRHENMLNKFEIKFFQLVLLTEIIYLE